MSSESEDTSPSPASIRSVLKAEFAKRLYVKIADRGWTQSEFARHCNVARDAVSTYVRGRSLPSKSVLERMAIVLGCQPQDLLPSYHFSGDKEEQGFELRDVPDDEGLMQIKLNMRLPKKVAMQIFMLAQEAAG